MLAASVAVVLAQADEPFFGAKETCDERVSEGEFGHRGWVECFKEIANRSLPERVFLIAWPWLVGWAVLAGAAAVWRRRAIRE